MNNTIFFWVVYSFLPLSAGSFLTVVTYRLPQMILSPASALTLCQPRSCCPCCLTPLKAVDLIPLFSWLMQCGRCRYCFSPISARYPVTEVLVWVGGVALAGLFINCNTLFCALLFYLLLLPLVMIDIRHLLLPDALTLPLLWSGLVIASLSSDSGMAACHAILGAVVGYTLLRLLATFGKYLKKREVLGRGDAKLTAALGAWVGVYSLSYVLIIASLGALSGVILAKLCWQRPLSRPLPFGPWLALGGGIVFISQQL